MKARRGKQFQRVLPCIAMRVTGGSTPSPLFLSLEYANSLLVFDDFTSEIVFAKHTLRAVQSVVGSRRATLSSTLQRAHIPRSDIVPILLGRTRRAPAGFVVPFDQAPVACRPRNLQARVACGIQIVVCIRLRDAMYRYFRIYIHSDTS